MENKRDLKNKERKYKFNQFYSKNKDKSRVLAIKSQLKSRRREVTNTSLGFVGIAIIVFFSFAVLRTILNEDFTFSLLGLLESLQTMPTVSIQSILSWQLNFPEWLAFLESLIIVVSFLGACLLNVVLTITWFVRFLFLV